MEGSCLCGQVRFEVSGLVMGGWGCSCEYCRKFTGSAFAVVVSFLEKNFRWLGGQDLISRFEKIPGTGPRCFCSRCGGPVPNDPDDGVVAIHLGCLDEEPDIKVQHFLHALPGWASELDVLPAYKRKDDGSFEGPGIEFHLDFWKRLSRDYERAVAEGDRAVIEDAQEFARIMSGNPPVPSFWRAYRDEFDPEFRRLMDSALAG